MRDTAPFNFGLVVAYLVPGFVILWGLAYHFPTVAGWLSIAPQNAPTVGDLFYATLAAVACGMIANVFRWAIIDTLHHWTGMELPRWDFWLLQERLGAYELLVELHYRYYQFFANMFVALPFAYVAWRFAPSGRAAPWGMTDISIVVVCVVLFLGSRDALRKYYHRAGELLTPTDRRYCHGERWRQGAPARAEGLGAQDPAQPAQEGHDGSGEGPVRGETDSVTVDSRPA